MRQSIKEILTEMADAGYRCELGHHVEPLVGYWAVFFKKGKKPSDDWAAAGHAYTLQGAVRHAQDLVRGVPHPGRPREMFEDE